MARSKRTAAPMVSFFAFQDIITSVSGILIILVLLMSTMTDDAGDTSAQEKPEPQPDGQTAGQLSGQLVFLQNEITKSAAVIKGMNNSPDPEAVRREIEALNDEIRAILQSLSGIMPSKEPRQGGAAGMLDADKVKLDELLRMLEAAKARLADEKKLAADKQNEIDRIRNEVFVLPGASADAKTARIVVVDGAGIALHTLGKDAPLARYGIANAPAQFAQFLGTLDPAADWLVFYIKPSGVPLFSQIVDAARKKGFQIGFDALTEAALPRFGPKPNTP